jgi:hypothetical protein
MVAALPREPFIGLFTTKSVGHARVDIEIISLNPLMPFPPSRLSLWCRGTFVGRVIWEVWNPPTQTYLQVLGFPPYQLVTRGSMFHPPHALLVLPLLLDMGMGFSFLPADWHHNSYLKILPQFGHIFFKYTPPPTAQNPAPIYFRRLRFISQIQTSMKAELT